MSTGAGHELIQLTNNKSISVETTKLRKKLGCYRVSLILVLLLFLVIISGSAVLWIFFGGLFCSHQDGLDAATNSKAFVLAAADILQSLDPSVDPCDDFFSYACNGWIQTHSIPKVYPSAALFSHAHTNPSISQGLASWSILEQRSQENFLILRSILENSSAVSTNAEVKARNFYKSCMKSSAVEESSSLHDIIRDVGGWNMTGSPIDMSLFDMRKKVLAVQKYTPSTLFTW